MKIKTTLSGEDYAYLPPRINSVKLSFSQDLLSGSNTGEASGPDWRYDDEEQIW